MQRRAPVDGKVNGVRISEAENYVKEHGNWLQEDGKKGTKTLVRHVKCGLCNAHPASSCSSKWHSRGGRWQREGAREREREEWGREREKESINL